MMIGNRRMVCALLFLLLASPLLLVAATPAIFTSPAADTTYGTSVPVTYSLPLVPTGGTAGVATLTWLAEITTTTTTATVTAGTTFSLQLGGKCGTTTPPSCVFTANQVVSFTLLPSAPAAANEVDSSTVTTIPDGRYTLTITYTDTATTPLTHNTVHTGVTIDTHSTAVTIAAPVNNNVYTEAVKMPVTYTQTETSAGK
jgi:hypothetical protein